MSLDVHVYTVEARKAGPGPGVYTEPAPYPACEFWTFDYEEAQGYAQEEGLIVIDNSYEWSDSEMLDDYSGEEET